METVEAGGLVSLQMETGPLAQVRELPAYVLISTACPPGGGLLSGDTAQCRFLVFVQKFQKQMQAMLSGIYF